MGIVMEQGRLKIKQIVTAIICATALLGLDQLTKYFAVVKLKNHEPFTIISGVFQLLYVENRGAAFGMLQGKKILFLVLSFVFLVLLCYCYVRMLGRKRFKALRVIAVFFAIDQASVFHYFHVLRNSRFRDSELLGKRSDTMLSFQKSLIYF